MEMSFNLQNALGYSGKTEADILSEYIKLNSVAVNALTKEPVFVTEFGIVVNQVRTRTGEVASTLTPMPAITGTPGPTESEEPVTPSPPGADSAGHALKAAEILGVLFSLWVVMF